MAASSSQTLESLGVGPLPVVNHVLDRLGVEAVLAEAMPPLAGRRGRLSPARVLGVFVRNLLLAREPLYGIPQWAAGFVPDLLGLTPADLPRLNDDRIGRCLDRLYEADRARVVTTLILRMVKEFAVDLDVLHNDSTSVSFTGRYPKVPRRRGPDPVWITYGFSKDHRPDLKQLIVELTVTADGGIPVLVGLHDGNVTEVQTHLATWRALRHLVGRPDFLYVADSKLCVTETLTTITRQGGHFVTVMPATRKEDAWFKTWVQTHAVPWVEVWRRPPVKRQAPPDIFLGCESPLPSAEGYRILWYHSSLKHERDQESRQARLRRAGADLEFLKTRLGARKLKTVEQVQAAATTLVEALGATRWIEVTVAPGDAVVGYRQSAPGRPGKATVYRRIIRPHPELTWRVREDLVAWDAKTDGLFPLMTDLKLTERKEADLTQVLRWYKYQPRLEKRFEQFKTVLGVRPVWLKSAARIEAYCLLFFIALLVDALIERELRRAMRDAKIKELPLYREARLCQAPTAERVLDLFSGFRRHRLFEGVREVNRFTDALSPLQRQVLRLLGVAPTAYVP